MKSTLFVCTALLALAFVFCGTGTLEAKRHSHFNINVGTSFVQRPAYGTYVVRPAYPQPVYVYPSYPDRVIVVPSPAVQYQEVVAVPTTPSINLFSFGWSWFR